MFGYCCRCKCTLICACNTNNTYIRVIPLRKKMCNNSRLAIETASCKKFSTSQSIGSFVNVKVDLIPFPIFHPWVGFFVSHGKFCIFFFSRVLDSLKKLSFMLFILLISLFRNLFFAEHENCPLEGLNSRKIRLHKNLFLNINV